MQTNLGPVVAELMRTWHSLHTDTPLQDWKTSTRWTQDQTIRVAKKNCAVWCCQCDPYSTIRSLQLSVSVHVMIQGLNERHGPPAVRQLVTGMQRSEQHQMVLSNPHALDYYGQQHLSLLSWPYESPSGAQQPSTPDAIDRHSLERMNMTKE